MCSSFFFNGKINMDDNEYYAMMRRQYSYCDVVSDKNNKNSFSKKNDSAKTEGKFSDWVLKYGHEDAEMFLERNENDDSFNDGN